jgi:hypothetical protein
VTNYEDSRTLTTPGIQDLIDDMDHVDLIKEIDYTKPLTEVDLYSTANAGYEFCFATTDEIVQMDEDPEDPNTYDPDDDSSIGNNPTPLEEAMYMVRKVYDKENNKIGDSRPRIQHHA